jgi:hypothetical protein
VNWIKSLLIKYKQEYLFLFESPQAFQFDDDLIDGMALQPAGAQRKIIIVPWVDFSLSCIATPFTGHSVRTLDLYNENISVGARATGHSRRLARRPPGSLSSSFNQANLHRIVRTDGIKTCVVSAFRVLKM